jgi:hypothetical protein
MTPVYWGNPRELHHPNSSFQQGEATALGYVVKCPLSRVCDRGTHSAKGILCLCTAHCSLQLCRGDSNSQKLLITVKNKVTTETVEHLFEVGGSLLIAHRSFIAIL